MSIDHSQLSRLSQIWPIVAAKFPDVVALYDPHSKPQVKLTYSQVWEKIQQFAAGLQALGLKKDEKISIFSDNSPRWLISDQGSLTAGAVNVVRSSLADTQELLYILKDSESVALIVENLKTWQKLEPHLGEFSLKFVILLSDEKAPEGMYNFEQLLELGSSASLTLDDRDIDSLATLIYTSGTSGQPKGVMLSQRNLLHQIVNLSVIVKPQSGCRVLSILPCWHSYERSCEYYLLSQGCTQIYTSIRYFKNDLKEHQPQVMIGVPRIWESLYEGIIKQFQQYPESKQKLIANLMKFSEDYILNKRIAQGLSIENISPSIGQKTTATLRSSLLFPLHLLADRLVYQKIRENLGGQFEILVSGGGALAKHLDLFFEIIGIPLLVGYGLTETSPVVTARTVERNLRGSAGTPLPETSLKIVHSETGQTLPNGETGIVLVKGTQVMQGYYNKPEATAKAIDAQGWFNTGDLGWLSQENDLILTGRAKDTIVLSNGENIEPEPIENACSRSPFIDQIMLVGQDQKALGALIVPNWETVKNWAKTEALELDFSSLDKILDKEIILEKYRQELTQQIKNRPGYRPDDQVKTFKLILEPFSQENGMMTQTLKVKRPVVMEHYRDIIVGMFDKS
jgi:long-chain acyl-CoA synthetase